MLKKITLRCRSDMVGLLGSTARRKFGDQRLAQVGATAAAILHQEGGNLPDSVDHGPIDDGPTMSLRLDKPGPGQNGEMRRHGVLRHLKAPSNFTRWQTSRFVFHEQPKRVEASDLRQCSEDIDSLR